MRRRQVNAFYFFTLDFRERQKKFGIQYENLREVSEAAGPSWREAPPDVRAHFEEMARPKKLKRNVPVQCSEIERQERELREAEEAEREYINNVIKLKSFNSEIIHEYFYLMDVNYYYKVNSDYLIGECTALRFNVKNGIKDQFHAMINPGPIPVGYAYDVKVGAHKLGLDMPDAITYKTLPYIDTLAIIVNYLKHGLPPSSSTLPPIYTMPEKVQPVLNFILQMCAKTGEDDGMFRVYKLDTLFYTLLNGVKNRGDEGFPRESLALAQLKKDPFRYTPGLGCRHHEDIDKAAECTSSRVKRWAYTIMDSCCPVVGVDMLPSKHVPGDFDLDTIINFREQKKERAGPSVAVPRWGEPSNASASDINQSSFNESANTSASTSAPSTSSKKEKKAQPPLRMPKTDYSQTLRPAPELTEANFPSFSAGRGRGLASSLNKMHIGKPKK